MAKRFKLADGTVGMLEEDGTFVPEGSASKPADLPESPFGGVVAPGEEGEHGVPVQKTHAYPMRTHTSEELGLDPGMADPTGQQRHISPAEAAHERENLMAQTPLEAKRAGDPIANDPIAQQIVTSGLGFGAGRLVGPLAGRLVGGAVEGGVGTAAGGGDPTTGAFLGALPAAAQIAKRGATAGLQGALDRSTERLAISPTPVRTAAGEAYQKAKEHALALTQAAVASGVLGSHYLGHGALAAAPFAIPVAKVGAVAADEAAANIARKFGMVPRATTAAEAAKVGIPAGPQAPHEHITVPEAPPTEREAARKAAAEALGRRRIESSGFRPAPAETRPLETTGTQSVTTPPIKRALENSATQREFIQTAVKKGYDARDARALWRAEHPYRPAK